MRYVITLEIAGTRYWIATDPETGGPALCTDGTRAERFKSAIAARQMREELWRTINMDGVRLVVREV